MDQKVSLIVGGTTFVIIIFVTLSSLLSSRFNPTMWTMGFLLVLVAYTAIWVLSFDQFLFRFPGLTFQLGKTTQKIAKAKAAVSAHRNSQTKKTPYVVVTESHRQEQSPPNELSQLQGELNTSLEGLGSVEKIDLNQSGLSLAQTLIKKGTLEPWYLDAIELVLKDSAFVLRVGSTGQLNDIVQIGEFIVSEIKSKIEAARESR